MSKPRSPRPVVLRFEPRSLPQADHVFAAHLSRGGQTVTVLTRRWPDEMEGPCGRCPAEACGLHGGVCQIIVPEFVPLDRCGDYRCEALTKGVAQ